jgi:prepilin-type N-terminal cleavage/methylation domain-containing protein
MRHQHGFTITELMVSVALMAIIIIWLMGFFVVQNRSYVVTDEVAEAQQNARTILDLIEREIRAAGMMIPENGAACGVDNTNAPDVLYVSDADSIDSTKINVAACENTAKCGAKVSAQVGGSLTVDSIVLDGSPYYITTVPGVPTSDFRCDTGNCGGVNGVAGGVILIDRNNPQRGVACGTITQIPNATTINVNFASNLKPLGLGQNFPDLRAIPAHVYVVVGNQLRRDNLVLANDVEDLQVAYFFDVIPNGLVDSINQEYPGSSPALPQNGQQYFSQNWDGSRLREIRVNVVIRTRTADLNLTASQPQATENRTGLVPDAPPELPPPRGDEHRAASKSGAANMSRTETHVRVCNRRREGSALLVAVMMLVLMGLIGMAALDSMTKDRQVAGFQNRARLAFYAADAGVAAGLNLVVTKVIDRSTTPPLPATALGDAVIYPYGQPGFRGDPKFPNPIFWKGDGGVVAGTSLQGGGPQFVNTLWQIRVEGQTPDGGRARLEAMATKMLVGGGTGY